MKYTSIIVEDLQAAADFLKKYCERSGIIEVQGHFLNAEDALTFLSENLVDIIFLDVEMPGLSGFELMDRLVYTPQVILTTSKTEYAYDAFQYNVTDYLKKPFTYQRFLEAVQKIQVRKDEQDAESGSDHIFIKADSKLVRLENEDILYVESMGDYVKFITADKKYITHNTIKNLEAQLDTQRFMKVHRSFIVNMARIDDIQENSLYIRGVNIPISKANKGKVMQRIKVV